MDRVEFIKKNMRGKTLDVGCTWGNLHSLIFNNNVYGLDLDECKIKKNFYKGDAQNMPFSDGFFDTIIAGELIEHLKIPEKFLKEAYRVLKKDGVIIITTPNKKSWMNRIFKNYNQKGHVSLFDINSLKKLVSKYFVIEKSFCLPYDKTTIWDSKDSHFFRIRKLVHHFIPQKLQEDVIILGRKL